MMQSLHALESGQIKIEDLNLQGLAHALITGRHERVGLSAEQLVAKWKEYVESVEGPNDNSISRAKESWREHTRKMRDEVELPIQAVGLLLDVLENIGVE